MSVPNAVRDSFVGTLVYHLSGRRAFRHPEEHPNFVLPERYGWPKQGLGDNSEVASQVGSDSATLADPRPGEKAEARKQETAVATTDPPEEPTAPPAAGADAEKGKSIENNAGTDVLLVDWYGPDDPECPRNVSATAVC